MSTFRQMPEDDIPVPDRSEEVIDMGLDWLQSSAFRLILTRLVPLIAASGVLATLIAWLQDVVGIDLDAAAVASLVGTIVLGAAAVAFEYIRNHGRGAGNLGVALIELEKLRTAGQQLLPLGQDEPPGIVDPVFPPGMETPTADLPDREPE